MGIQIAVAHGEGCREPAFQLLQQSGEGGFLGRCACVSRASAVVQSAFVADADAVAVMAEAVCALGRERPAGMYPTVACDVIVVAYVPEVPETDVVPAAVLERVRLPAARGAAMDDEQCDTSHASLFFLCVCQSVYMQAVTPKALPKAVATTMITLRMTLQMDFFSFFSAMRIKIYDL